jgi:hypothetical protein
LGYFFCLLRSRENGQMRDFEISKGDDRCYTESTPKSVLNITPWQPIATIDTLQAEPHSLYAGRAVQNEPQRSQHTKVKRKLSDFFSCPILVSERFLNLRWMLWEFH